MKKRVLFNIDKLKMSYLQPSGLFEAIAKHQVGDDIHYEDFYLKIVDDGRCKKPEKQQTYIIALAVTNKGELMGQLTLHNSDEFERRAFFEFDNKFLYSGNATTNQNNEPYWDYAASTLGLTLATITQIDIACDTSKNLISRVRRLVRDWENFDMIVNGKKIIDENQIIDDYALHFGTSRVKMSRTPTLYYRQSYEQGLKERIYNKSAEIKHGKNVKKYIADWDNMGEASTIYRAEVQITWKMLKTWFEYLSDSDATHQYAEWARRPGEDQSHYICRTRLLMGLNEYRAALWHWATSRLVYWREKASGERIDQVDLIE